MAKLQHQDVVAFLKEGQQKRTDQLLERLARHPDREWNMLHGVLCMSHGLGCDDTQLSDAVFDGNRIAGRLDELNRQATAAYKASK